MSHTDFFKEYQNRKQSSDKIFESVGLKNELFSFAHNPKDPGSKLLNKKEDETDSETGNTKTNTNSKTNPTHKLIKTNQGYQFGGPERSVTKITMPANSVYETYEWDKGPLKYLFNPELKFKAKTMAFDLERGVLLNFNGEWDGPYIGKTFVGIYKGNSFQGNFVGDNKGFKAQPTSFVDGTFTDTTKTGILGRPNVLNATEIDDFDLIQVPVGYSIEILTSKQLRHTITVSKRLDNIDSNFQYTVFMGYDLDSVPNNITIPWSKIRQNYDAYVISVKNKSISDLLTLQSDEKIIEFKVLKAGTPPVFKKKIAFNPKKEYSEDSTKLAGLNSLLGGKRYGFGFKLNDDQDFENFNKMKGYINSPVFMQDLNSISTFLDNNIITQNDTSKFNYLSKILTPEVLSEANFLGGSRKRTKGQMSVSAGGVSSTSNIPKNQVTGKPLKSAADIATYLSKKYEKDLKAGKQDNYNKEYGELYNLIILKKTPPRTISSQQQAAAYSPNLNQSQSKDSDKVLKRLDNFVKDFVYKIDMGEQTNQWRAFILDIIKKKIQQHKAEQPKEQPEEQPIAKGQTAATGQTATTTTTGQPVQYTTRGVSDIANKLSESFIRSEVKKVLDNLL